MTISNKMETLQKKVARFCSNKSMAKSVLRFVCDGATYEQICKVSDMLNKFVASGQCKFVPWSHKNIRACKKNNIHWYMKTYINPDTNAVDVSYSQRDTRIMANAIGIKQTNTRDEVPSFSASIVTEKQLEPERLPPSVNRAECTTFEQSCEYIYKAANDARWTYRLKLQWCAVTFAECELQLKHNLLSKSIIEIELDLSSVKNTESILKKTIESAMLKCLDIFCAISSTRDLKIEHLQFN